MPHFASQTKLDWSPDPDLLIQHAEQVAALARASLERDGIDDDRLTCGTGGRLLLGLPAESKKLLLSDSISPIPLHKTLLLLEHMQANRDERYYLHELLALATALVTSIGNLHFGPEVGVGRLKQDAPVIRTWLARVQSIADDLRQLPRVSETTSKVVAADARHILEMIEPNSVDAVITSPPYPNEKDYTRTTRLESVILGFIRNRIDLRALKHNLVRSNTRNVYKTDDDDSFVASHRGIQELAAMIEAKRVEMGKTSGFERLYAKVTKLYFGGMAQHLARLRPALRPGARLAYVVGDQASYFAS